MLLAIHDPWFTHTGGAGAMARTLVGTARAAEGGGSSRFTVMDHRFPMRCSAERRVDCRGLQAATRRHLPRGRAAVGCARGTRDGARGRAALGTVGELY